MMSYLDEAQIEAVTLDFFQGLGYAYVHGPAIAPDGDKPERTDYGQVFLIQRLRDALRRINPARIFDKVAFREIKPGSPPSEVEMYASEGRITRWLYV